MEPHLTSQDKLMFYRYLDTATNYFEFGSRGSTYQASIRDNIKKIFSVESDHEWYNKLKNIITKDNFTYIFNDMDARPNNWGYPGNRATSIQKISYSNHFTELKDPKSIDFILIDGRFRVACCLKCFNLMNDDCLIAFDDFLDRPQYHIVLNYFNIVDRTPDNRMVILKKKREASLPQNIISKYELIAN
jgi:hypothetical protein